MDFGRVARLFPGPTNFDKQGTPKFRLYTIPSRLQPTDRPPGTVLRGQAVVAGLIIVRHRSLSRHLSLLRNSDNLASNAGLDSARTALWRDKARSTASRSVPVMQKRDGMLPVGVAACRVRRGSQANAAWLPRQHAGRRACESPACAPRLGRRKPHAWTQNLRPTQQTH